MLHNIEQSCLCYIVGPSKLKKKKKWSSRVVQWLRLHPSTAGGTDSIPGRGTKIPHAAWPGQKIFLKSLFIIFQWELPLLGYRVDDVATTMPLPPGGACLREERRTQEEQRDRCYGSPQDTASRGLIAYEARSLFPSFPLFTIPFIECDLDHCSFQPKSLD